MQKLLTILVKEQGGIMRQLSFGFLKEANAKFIIKFSPNIKGGLIRQMAIAIIKVNKKKGGNNNDSLTNK
jgi:hypothetical protein